MSICYDAFDLVYFGCGHGVQCTNSSVAKSLVRQASILRMSKALPDADPHVRWCGRRLTNPATRLAHLTSWIDILYPYYPFRFS